MAAVIAPHHSPSPRRPHRPARPALRVIEGGRNPGDPWIPGPTAPVRPRVRPTGPRSIPARVYRQRRIAAAVLVAVVASVLALAIVGAASLLTSALSSPSAGAATTVDGAAPVADAPVWVVQPGDTLWTIAAELRPDGDPRPLVDALADRAGGASLQAGQRIPLDGLAA